MAASLAPGKTPFPHTTVPAVMQVLTSCVPGKMLLLAEVVTGDGFGSSPRVGMCMCELTVAPVGQPGTCDPDLLCFPAPCPFVL